MSDAQRSAAQTPDWSSVRRDYPAAVGRAYLDTACKGIPSSFAAKSVIDHVEALRESGSASASEDTLLMLAQFDRARAAAAEFLNASPSEIALVPSTEGGLAAIAAALQFDSRATVVASDLDFVGTILPWSSLQHRGTQLKLVAHRSGRVDIADIDAAIDKSTRAVVISSVQEVNGYRLDLDVLSHLCHTRDVLLIVDAIQHVGPLPLDVSATSVDAVAVGGHKWLGAPFGMGFLYVARTLAEELEPPLRSLMTAQAPPQGWLEYLESPHRHPLDPLDFASDARKLELGALGTSLAAAGLGGALQTLLEIGPRAIRARSAQLAEATWTALTEAGAEVVTPREGLPSTIVTFRAFADVDAERALVQTLASRRILASLRFSTGVGGIRISPYFYNDESDIDHLASVVADAIQRRRRSLTAKRSVA